MHVNRLKTRGNGKTLALVEYAAEHRCRLIVTRPEIAERLNAVAQMAGIDLIPPTVAGKEDAKSEKQKKIAQFFPKKPAKERNGK